jgi:glycosyltransferase involved in cell wall biosynthesis
MMKENQPCLENRQTYEYMFTVFTATYNRAYTLHRVYESLKNQTYQSFEWIIFDNGSTDNTYDLIQQWQQNSSFPIRYLPSCENLGLNLAINRGLLEAKGEFFVQFDSDDACFPYALERFKYHWDSIPVHLKAQFVGVTCLWGNETGNVVGGHFPFNPTDSDSLEIRHRFKVVGDKWGCNKTDVMRQFPFPDTLEKGTYISQNLMWNRIARQYKTRFVNEVLGTVRNSLDSMTRARPHPTKHAFNKQLHFSAVLNEEMDWFRYAPFSFLLTAAHYSRFSFHGSRNLSQQIKQLHNTISGILWAIALPLGYLLFLRDHVVYHFQKDG